ncbi:PREDICTED: serine/threonine-protein kinase EDR1 [Nelumbo nucifera]|uniref:non-specific serine/threonine protein kinase n=2 Tax=Nelumbo nucifera TaxID=4432 RepID=A0A822YKI5_NELNU|nr:PREDICTED: serine/threonine-protein kinase EDR1 [Nelumbo nucifera]DAD32071.1 TPA_asm: hypothetical protein HUJ06_010922 [Nelumbo nucifera]
MKNILKKLHIMPNQSEDTDGSTSSRGHRLSDDSTGRASPSRASPSHHHHHSEQKPFSSISGWLNSVTSRHSPSPPSSSNAGRGERRDPLDSLSSSSLDFLSDAVRRDSSSSNSRDPGMDEEYQIQLALELSAQEDPEAVQIEAVKQISLGSCSSQNTTAEVVAYRYWNYNALGYDDKILDGFYDLYGILAESTSEKMPSLVDLQGAPVSDGISWEAVLVNRAADVNLLKLEQKALVMAVESRSGPLDFMGSDLVKKLAALVADYMGGPVGDPVNMLKAWRNLSNRLRTTVGSMVLPLGSLTIGLARHRALLFKVLADSVGIPCRLVKGLQYTGSDNVAMNIVKVDDGREYIVDLMADPGTLIPSDAGGTQIEYEEPVYAVSPFLRDIDYSHVASYSSGATSSIGGCSEFGPLNKKSGSYILAFQENESDKKGGSGEVESSENTGVGSSQECLPTVVKDEVVSKLSDDHRDHYKIEKSPAPIKPNHPYMHARSPSWTEGVSSPAVRRMKVKDVSQYMIDAAKENPQLAQKLHDVLLESGVVAPPNLFSEIDTEQLDPLAIEAKKQKDDKEGKKKRRNGTRNKDQTDISPGQVFPPLPCHDIQSKSSPGIHLEHPKCVEGLGVSRPLDVGVGTGPSYTSESELSAASAKDTSPAKFVKHVPVAAAAAATAAVVASSMVVAAAMSNSEANLGVPVTAAATATAAAVVATTAAVSRQYEQLESYPHLPNNASSLNQIEFRQKDGVADRTGNEPQGSDRENSDSAVHPEAERSSDRSAGNDSAKSDIALDDVAEWEIPWEEITLGERIGLGSYGEVYRGEWHGTEVAVKKFLDQDISGDALEEFRSEVRIMKRLRHPNVVLFMGAVTRAPNLSIVTEFLPRGSLYRLIHRPNNQLDERRRLRMALDVARGMNYLHNCTPVIVHRDLKSPNLLVDKNWVVKVCDFGLSRMKHNTFLSSRSTAGTAEWMAPEVLRNEPSDEKCDVYSFGVILWELSTLQQPWGGMNPMQVVGAVGFQHRRLDIPDDMDPIVADIIQRCWQTEPKKRPTFSEIMAALKPLQKPVTSSQVPRPRAPINSVQEKGEPSQGT